MLSWSSPFAPDCSKAAGGEFAEALRRLVGTSRRAGETDHHIAVFVGVDVHVSVADIEDGLGIAKLEIDAAAADLNIGNRVAMRGAGLRAMIEQRLNVPGPGWHLDYIDAGRIEPETGERELAREQAGPADARLHGFDVREGLDAGGWIVVDQNVVHGEAGTGEEIQVNRAQVNGPVERGFERGLDARAQPIGARMGAARPNATTMKQRNEKRTPEELHGCCASRSA